MNSMRLNTPDQIGYLVNDVDTAIRRWQQHFGVGPWTLFRQVRLEGEYRGQATSIGMDVALGYQGQLQIELIQPLPASASPYHGADGHVLVGMHHLAWVVDDFDAALTQWQKTGLHVVFQGHNPGTQVAYLENPQAPSMLYEIIHGPQMREMIALGIAATRDWDGTGLVNEIKP